MLREMSASEYQEWIELWEIDPWGEERIERQIAAIECTYVNANRDRDRHPLPLEVDDFIPKRGVRQEAKPQQSVAEQKQLASTLAAVMRGTIPGGSDRTA